MTQIMENDFQWGQKYVKLHLADTVVEAREIIVPLPPSKNKLHEVNYVGVKEVFSHQYVNSKKTKRGVIKTSTEYNRWKSSTARELKRGKNPLLMNLVMFLLPLFYLTLKVTLITMRKPFLMRYRWTNAYIPTIS